MYQLIGFIHDSALAVSGKISTPTRSSSLVPETSRSATSHRAPCAALWALTGQSLHSPRELPGRIEIEAIEAAYDFSS